ncbi:MAG: class I tRNA ligase family protein, partial [Oscillospiraceae bacterium]|nr:class I tRNA ligase family protein [Oscillospiraceae bacterium]
MKFNTAIAQMMTLVNELSAAPQVTRAELETLLKLLCPVAPHICEEMWQNLGHAEAIHHASWPTWDEAALVKQEVEIAVQVNGKVRGRILIPADLSKADAEAQLPDHEAVKQIIGDKQIVKVVFVPGRLLNIVVK